MIYIFEDDSRELSGTKSLFINFKYDQQIVNLIKSSETYKFHKDNHLWEVPITSLAYLLDNFVYFDEVQLIVEDEDENRQFKTLKGEHRTKLYDYQKEGVEYCLNHNKCLLLDEPGLGKTLQMITLGEELKLQENIEHVLIICGIASLRTNWEKEVFKHSTENCRIIGARVNRNNNLVWDSIDKRVEQLMNPIDEFFVIINVESLRYDKIINAIKNGPNKYDLMVLDEAHKCKGSGSIQSLNLLELKSKYQVAMTGTLLINSPLDAYIPLVWIGVEKGAKIKGASGISHFKDMYCVFDRSFLSKKEKAKKYNKGRIVGYKNLDIFKDELESCSLRRTKDILDLPEKNFIDELLIMDNDQSKFYDTIKDAVVEEVKELAKELCDKVELNTSNLLALSTRLRQASTCPSVLTSQDISSCKINRAIDLVEEITSNGDKVVIMSMYKEPVRILEELLKDYKPLIGTGEMKDGEVSQNIDIFQKDDEHKVFIGTISKMGTGVTLNKATYMIFIDLPWEPASYQQACDRIHRIGTKKPVFIYNLICKDTIDELTLQAIKRKQALSDYLVDNNTSDSVMSIISKYLLDLK